MKTHTIDFKNQLTELGRELRGVITYNNTELEELVDRAMEDANNNSDEEVVESNQNDIENSEKKPEFNGVFHERDSLSVNNIVDEVKENA